MALLSLRVTEERCCVLHGQQPLPPAGVSAISSAPLAGIQHPGDAEAPRLRLILAPQFTAFLLLPRPPWGRTSHFSRASVSPPVFPSRPQAVLSAPGKVRLSEMPFFNTNSTKQSVLRYRRSVPGSRSYLQQGPITRGQNVLETWMRPLQAPALPSHPTNSCPQRCWSEPWPPLCCSPGIFFLGGVLSVAFPVCRISSPPVPCHLRAPLGR